jgi:hypothetical protein
MPLLTDGFLGVLARLEYRIEVWKTSPPKKRGQIPEGDYLYVTKITPDGYIGEHSMGFPESDLPELLAILHKADLRNRNS